MRAAGLLLPYAANQNIKQSRAQNILHVHQETAVMFSPGMRMYLMNLP